MKSRLISPVEKEENPNIVLVSLEDGAFWSLMISAVEVYRRECFGLLLGNFSARTRIARIETAISFQVAKRAYSWVAQGVAAEKRIKAFLKNVPHLEFMGHFHSHGEGPMTLSEADRKLLQKDELMLLIGIYRKKKKVPWHVRPDGVLSGTFGDYRFELKGYGWNEKNGREVRVPLISQSLMGIGALGARYVKSA